MIVEEKELQHFGVPGMKWGVRKAGGGKSTAYARGKSGLWPKKPTPLIRALAQLPGESDAEFDRAYTKAWKADQKAARSKSRKAYAAAAKRRSDTKKLIKELVKEGEGRKGYDAKKEKAFWDNMFKEDLNATPSSMKKEKIKQGAMIAGLAVAVIGQVAATTYINNKLKSW